MKVKQYSSKKLRRQIRTRIKTKGTAARPRLSVFRSNKFVHVQLIDDASGKSLFTLNDKSLKLKGTKTERALGLGKEAAKVALEKNVKEVVFDRGSYRYHGRVKAVADGAREGGLKF